MPLVDKKERAVRMREIAESSIANTHATIGADVVATATRTAIATTDNIAERRLAIVVFERRDSTTGATGHASRDTRGFTTRSTLS